MNIHAHNINCDTHMYGTEAAGKVALDVGVCAFEQVKRQDGVTFDVLTSTFC